MAWHRRTATNLSLRAAGVMLLAVAYLCGTWLRADACMGPIDGSPIDFLLAAVTFLSATGGSLLLILGAHIFDRVEIAPRWHRINQSAAHDESEPR